MLSLAQIRFCAVECKWQQSGEESVADMCDAFSWAFECAKQELPLTRAMILRLGQKVEPVKNLGGFRTHNVYFHNDPTKQALKYQNIEQAVESLLHHGDHLSPDEAYMEFQKIHPFIDGNGRVGSILWNTYWMGRDRLENPILPPDFFGTKAQAVG